MAERLSSSGRRVALAGVAILFAAPLTILVVQSLADSWRDPSILPQELGLRGFDVAFGSARAGPALINSVLIAVGATAISLLAGWPAARALGARRLPRSAPLLLLLGLPLLMPPYLAGFGLTEWFIRLGLDDSVFGLVLAHVVFTLPYVILILLSGFGRDLDQVEEMARTLGLGRWRRLRWVTIPALRPTLAAAALLSFLVSWSQYGSSLGVGAGRSTLPVVMLPFVGNDPQVAAAIGLVFLVPCLLVLAAAVWLRRDPL